MRGHDVPIVVMETMDSINGRESMTKWKHQVEKTSGRFAPVPRMGTFYTSLGNGHFFAALNLFRNNMKCLWDDTRYSVNEDVHLANAVRTGVRSVVLRDIPRRERRFLSEVLNSSFTYAWCVSEKDGSVRITNVAKNADDENKVSQFEALSKSLDSFELEALVAQHRSLNAKSRL